jgi:hypothetical protein
MVLMVRARTQTYGVGQAANKGIKLHFYPGVFPGVAGGNSRFQVKPIRITVFYVF